MSMQRAFSLFIRVGAASMLLAGMASHAPPARSAPFLASTAFPQVPNLAGYWPLDSAGGGTVSDLSGTLPANNGTLMGAAAIDTTNKAPVPSGNPASLATAASNDIVSVLDSPSLSVTGSLTVAAWIRPTAAPVSPGPQHGIIEKWDWNGSTAINGYFLRLSPLNELTFTIAAASSNVGIGTYPRQVPTNVWTHVAGVYDAAAGSMKLYKSDDNATDFGAPDPTMTSSGVPPPGNGSNPLDIGDGQGAQQFVGNIDEARVYTKPLTDNEILILVSMNQPPAQAPSANVVGSQVVVSWGAASNAASVPVVYSVLRGTSSGVYDTVFNNISALTYSDTPPASGTYYYTVAAVSVIPSVYATEQTVPYTSTPPPPPPPTGPRTPKGQDSHNRCGCATTPPLVVSPAVAGAALLAAALLLGLERRLR
jgi:hypothetical protein